MASLAFELLEAASVLVWLDSSLSFRTSGLFAHL